MTYEEAMQMILPGRYRHFKGNEYCNSTWYLYGTFTESFGLSGGYYDT